MAAGRRNPRRFEPGGSGPDHHHLAWSRSGARRPVGFSALAEARVVELRDGLAGVHLAPAEVVEDAGADLVFAAFAGLVRERGVAHLRAGHAHEISVAFGHDPFGQARGADPAERHHRNAARDLSHAPVQVDEMPRTEVHVGDVVLETQAEVALPVGEQVERAGRCEPLGDPGRLVDVDTALDPFVSRHLEPDDERLAAGVANALRGLAHEPGASFEVAAVSVLARIGPRREELGDEIAVCAVQLDPVESAAREPPRHRDVGIDEPRALLRRHDPRHCPAQRVRLVGDPGRGPGRMPELLATRMPELAENAPAGRVHFVRDLLEARIVRLLVPGDDRPVRECLRVHRDDLAHDQPASAPRTLGEKVDPPIRDAVPGPEVGQGRGKRDAVAQRPRPDLKVREQVRVPAAACVHAIPPGDDDLANSPSRAVRFGPVPELNTTLQSEDAAVPVDSISLLGRAIRRTPAPNDALRSGASSGLSLPDLAIQPAPKANATLQGEASA